jgi:hypothetical protein
MFKNEIIPIVTAAKRNPRRTELRIWNKHIYGVYYNIFGKDTKVLVAYMLRIWYVTALLKFQKWKILYETLWKLGVLNWSEADVIGLHFYVSLNSPVFHFGSLKFDNNKGSCYSVLEKEATKFRFWINSLWTVEVVLLISSSGLVSSVQFPVASVITVTGSWYESSVLSNPAQKYKDRKGDGYILKRSCLTNAKILIWTLKYLWKVVATKI